ncbi:MULTISPECIES: hypothetical protein [unclassified Streptomyces]|uniref:hypothetical protein n=1 Tax=unclassified Streptomyces TaxID=2593676 RepID=UPI000ADA2562|nr:MULTISPECIES: hypothetical protein [unclassified Streptomyces]
MSADRIAEADAGSEEPEADWHQCLDATLTPLASMVASILSLAALNQRRRA